MWFSLFAEEAYKTLPADSICCDWRFKGLKGLTSNALVPPPSSEICQLTSLSGT